MLLAHASCCSCCACFLLGNLLEILESHGRTRYIAHTLLDNFPSVDLKAFSRPFSLSFPPRVHLVPDASFPKGSQGSSSCVSPQPSRPSQRLRFHRVHVRGTLVTCVFQTQTLVGFQLTSGATALWHRYTFAMVACRMWLQVLVLVLGGFPLGRPLQADVDRPSRVYLG